MRGFATAGIGPRDMLSANQDALGGRMFYSTTAELLFQIPGVPQDMGLRGAVFADAGSLWGVNKTACDAAGPRRQHAGAARLRRASGLAWDSPIGALRADYAIPDRQAALRQDAALQLRPDAVLRAVCRSRLPSRQSW